MLQATVSFTISSVQCAVRDAHQLRGFFHFQIFCFNRFHNAFSEWFLPELWPPAARQIIIHFDNVSPLFLFLWRQHVLCELNEKKKLNECTNCWFYSLTKLNPNNLFSLPTNYLPSTSFLPPAVRHSPVSLPLHPSPIFLFFTFLSVTPQHRLRSPSPLPFAHPLSLSPIASPFHIFAPFPLPTIPAICVNCQSNLLFLSNHARSYLSLLSFFLSLSTCPS